MKKAITLIRNHPLPIKLPMAEMHAKTDQLMDFKHWLYADPIQVQVQQKGVICLGNGHLELSPEESIQLQNDINKFLESDQVKLYTTKDNRWLLGSDEPISMETKPLDEVVFKEISACQPTGEGIRKWQSLLAELQMLLHTHPVNQNRQAKKLPTIDSLWFWGNGDLTQVADCPWDAYMGDHPGLHVLSRFYKKPFYKSLEDIDATLSSSLIWMKPDLNADDLKNTIIMQIKKRKFDCAKFLINDTVETVTYEQFKPWWQFWR